MASTLSQFNLSEIEDEAGFYRTLFRLHDISVESCLPAVVEEYDIDKGTVTVVPIVGKVYETEDGESIQKRVSITVPVLSMCGGGFSLQFPLFKGDRGLLLAFDRNCKGALDNKTEQPTEDSTDEDEVLAPDDALIRKFANGAFISLASWGENKAESGVLVLKKTAKDGTATEIRLKDGEIKVVASNKVTLNKDGIDWDGSFTREQQLITAIRYDYDTQQIQCKTVTAKMSGDFVTEMSEESDWNMISGGQAVAYDEEESE